MFSRTSIILITLTFLCILIQGCSDDSDDSYTMCPVSPLDNPELCPAPGPFIGYNDTGPSPAHSFDSSGRTLGTYYFWPQNQRQTGLVAKFEDSKSEPVAANNAPQTENTASVSSTNQQYANPTEQKDFHKNEEPLTETNNLIQGASTGA